MREWVERVVEAFNAHDVDRYVAVAGTEDVVIDHSASPTPLRGRDEVRSFFAAGWRAIPDARLDLDDGPFMHPSAPRVSLRWRLSGTNTGPIDPPGFAPTGRRVEIPVLEVAEFRETLVCRSLIVLDMADYMRQLGLLAAPGSRAERTMAALQRLQARVSRRR